MKQSLVLLLLLFCLILKKLLHFGRRFSNVLFLVIHLHYSFLMLHEICSVIISIWILDRSLICGGDVEKVRRILFLFSSDTLPLRNSRIRLPPFGIAAIFLRRWLVILTPNFRVIKYPQKLILQILIGMIVAMVTICELGPSTSSSLILASW
jgi:hypothetical protein